MNARLQTALAIAGLAIATQAAAQITFYEREDFRGRTFTTQGALDNLNSQFGDRASSVIVLRGRWEVCDDAGFRGRCAVLRPGRYPSLADTGLNDRISSVRDVQSSRRVRDEQYAPPPMPVYDSHRRGGERLYQANITSVRAVVATPERRCWVEREQVAAERGSASVPGAIAGAVIGGILGHQIGGGTGRDIATAGGVVAGAAVGANVGRNDGTPAYTRDVQRCASAPAAARPDYWDVTYTFRGREHHMQTAEAPGATVTVNRQGEPRSPSGYGRAG